jgi:hypothetical protein
VIERNGNMQGDRQAEWDFRPGGCTRSWCAREGGPRVQLTATERDMLACGDSDLWRPDAVMLQQVKVSRELCKG